MEAFIVFLCVVLYFMSFWCVCDEFSKRKVEPNGFIPLIVLFFPIVNTLYWLIVGADWKLKDNDNLKRMFGKLPEKEKEEK